MEVLRNGADFDKDAWLYHLYSECLKESFETHPSEVYSRDELIE